MGDGSYLYTGLGVAVRAKGEDYIEFGVILEGEFVSLAAVKSGQLEPELSQRRAAAASAASEPDPSATTS
jgi:hypothetical protein